MSASQTLLDLGQRAFRNLVRHPWHSLGVMSLLALGLGPVLAISALADRLLLHPAQYPEPERVVAVYGVSPDYDRCQFNATSYRQVQTGTRAFHALGAFASRELALGRGVEAVSVSAGRVTADFFRTLRPPARAGRLVFSAEEDRWGGPHVVVLTERAWRLRCGGDAAILGRTLQLDGQPHTVIGVLAGGFSAPSSRLAQAECFVPAAFSPEEQVETGNNWELVGRLSAGITLAQAQAELQALGATKVIRGRTGFRAVPIAADLAGTWRRPLGLFAGASILLLLLAGINAAHLILARAEGRRGDLAVASALGAPATHLAGLHLAEGLGLATGGLGFGILVAWIVRQLLANHLGLVELPPFSLLTLATGTAGMVVMVLLASGVPAWVAARTSPMGALKAEGRGSTGGGRPWVLLAELALASVLLVGSSLLLRSLIAFSQFSTGLTVPEQVLTATITLPSGAYPTPSSRAQAFMELEDRLSALPGVTHAALAQTGPFFKPNGYGELTTQDGRVLKVNSHGMSGDLPGTLGLRLREGRLPHTGEPALLISENLAQDLWPKGVALGRSLEGTTVVGIVSACAEYDPRKGFARQLWRPLDASWDFVDVLLRSRDTPEHLIPALRNAVRQTGPDLQLINPEGLATTMGRAQAELRKAAELVGTLSLGALLLSVAGIYGVATQLILRRRREFGVRLAFGATPKNLAVMVVSQGVRLVALGLSLGLLVSIWVTFILKNLLQGVSNLDPFSYLLGAAVMFAATLLALALPALRAARVQPAEALRGE